MQAPQALRADDGQQEQPRVSRFRRNGEQDHWFMPPARLQNGLIAHGRKSALGLPQHFRKTFDGARPGAFDAAN
jgi:hypothetical protein